MALQAFRISHKAVTTWLARSRVCGGCERQKLPVQSLGVPDFLLDRNIFSAEVFAERFERCGVEAGSPRAVATEVRLALRVCERVLHDDGTCVSTTVGDDLSVSDHVQQDPARALVCHMLWLDGVYEPVAARPDKPRLRRARAPTSAQLTQLAGKIAHRVCRHLVRKGWLEALVSR